MYINLFAVTESYKVRAERMGQKETFIVKAIVKPRHWYLDLLDKIVGKMPNIEKEKLQKKFDDVVPEASVVWDKQYDDRFSDILVEILGWGYLYGKFPGHIPQFTTTPDLLVTDGRSSPVAAMECKQFWESDEEREWWADHNWKTGNVDRDAISGPFLKKLHSVLHRAECQLSDAKCGGSQRFILLTISLDSEIAVLRWTPEFGQVARREVLPVS